MQQALSFFCRVSKIKSDIRQDYKVAWHLELSKTGPLLTVNITNPVCVVYSLAGGSFSIDDYSPM